MGYLNTAKTFDVWRHLEGDAHRLLLYMAHVSRDQHSPPTARIKLTHALKALGLEHHPDQAAAAERARAAMRELIRVGAVVRGVPAPHDRLSTEWCLCLEPGWTFVPRGKYTNEHGNLASHWMRVRLPDEEAQAA